MSEVNSACFVYTSIALFSKSTAAEMAAASNPAEEIFFLYPH